MLLARSGAREAPASHGEVPERLNGLVSKTSNGLVSFGSSNLPLSASPRETRSPGPPAVVFAPNSAEVLGLLEGPISESRLGARMWGSGEQRVSGGEKPRVEFDVQGVNEGVSAGAIRELGGRTVLVRKRNGEFACVRGSAIPRWQDLRRPGCDPDAANAEMPVDETRPGLWAVQSLSRLSGAYHRDCPRIALKEPRPTQRRLGTPLHRSQGSRCAETPGSVVPGR